MLFKTGGAIGRNTSGCVRQWRLQDSAYAPARGKAGVLSWPAAVSKMVLRLGKSAPFMSALSARFLPPGLRPWSVLATAMVFAVLFVVAGCKRVSAPAGEADAAPAVVVQQLAAHLRNNDLVGYAKAMVTPAQYVQLEAAWRAGRSRWPLTELPLSEELPVLLATLSRPDAERTLQQAFNTQIAGQAASVRQAARSLGVFGVQYLRNQGDYSPAQRAHYAQQVTALSQWAATAPLTDRARADQAIAALATAARDTGLDSDSALREAGMEESLRRLGPFWGTIKSVLVNYGLSLDNTLDALRAEGVEQTGTQAQVRVEYPLAGVEIDTPVGLVSRDGRWYLQRTQDEVERVLAPSRLAAPDSTPTAGR